MSFVYVQNCALAHIMAAVTLLKEQRLSIKSGLNGRHLFVKDADVNFCNFYRRLLGYDEAIIYLPWWLLYFVILFAELLDHFCFYLFKFQLQDPMTGLTRSVMEACGYLTCNADLACRLLSYNSFPLLKTVKHDEAIKITRQWSLEKSKLIS
jgi:hypothetical protein